MPQPFFFPHDFQYEGRKASDNGTTFIRGDQNRPIDVEAFALRELNQRDDPKPIPKPFLENALCAAAYAARLDNFMSPATLYTLASLAEQFDYPDVAAQARDLASQILHQPVRLTAL
jgi:hypothetical protein